MRERNFLIALLAITMLLTSVSSAKAYVGRQPGHFKARGTVTSVDQATGTVAITINNTKSRWFAANIGKNIPFQLNSDARIGRYRMDQTGSRPQRSNTGQEPNSQPRTRAERPSLPFSAVQPGSEVRVVGHYQDGRYIIEKLNIGI